LTGASRCSDAGPDIRNRTGNIGSPGTYTIAPAMYQRNSIMADHLDGSK